MSIKMVATLDAILDLHKSQVYLISIETKQFVTDVFGAAYFEMWQTVYRNSISDILPTLSQRTDTRLD